MQHSEQQKSILEVLKAGKSKGKVVVNSVSAENLLPASWMVLILLCPHVVEGTKELSGVPFMRVLISFLRASPS